MKSKEKSKELRPSLKVRVFQNLNFPKDAPQYTGRGEKS